jgi:hypothetical protein
MNRSLPSVATLSLTAFTLCACAPFATPNAPAEAEATEDNPWGLWDWCPAPQQTTAVNDDALWLQFHPDALYCSRTPAGTWDTEVEIWDELDDQFQLRLVPSDLFLPREPGEYETEMPVCLRGGNSDRPAPDEAGRLVVERETVLGQDRLRYTWERTLTQESGRQLTVRVFIDGFEWALDGGVRLDGEPWPTRSDPTVRLYLCEGDTCEGEIVEDPPPEEEEPTTPAVITWDACRFEDMGEETYFLTFDGGELTLKLENEGDPYSRRHAFVSASGTLLGSAFEQTNFWRLGMRESYPYSYSKDIAVVFDEPIGADCGLTLKELYPGGYVSGGITLKKCDAALTDELRSVFNVEWESVTPEDEAP